MKSAVFWDITRRRVVVFCRRFGTTYRSHLHGSRIRVGFLTLRMGTICCPETSANNYNTTQRKIPEVRRFNHIKLGTDRTSKSDESEKAVRLWKCDDSDCIKCELDGPYMCQGGK